MGEERTVEEECYFNGLVSCSSCCSVFKSGKCEEPDKIPQLSKEECEEIY